jgi:hypothetical protein
MQECNIDFGDMIKAWGAPAVRRKDLAKFSGGLLDPRSVANDDSRGKGIRPRFRVGRHTAYPVEAVVEYLRRRTVLIDPR